LMTLFKIILRFEMQNLLHLYILNIKQKGIQWKQNFHRA
jgi:hypothetical protein